MPPTAATAPAVAEGFRNSRRFGVFTIHVLNRVLTSYQLVSLVPLNFQHWAGCVVSALAAAIPPLPPFHELARRPILPCIPLFPFCIRHQLTARILRLLISLSVPPSLNLFACPPPDPIRRGLAEPQSAAPCLPRGASSDASRPAAASSIGHVSPADRPSSPTAAAGSSATSCQPAAATRVAVPESGTPRL